MPKCFLIFFLSPTLFLSNTKCKTQQLSSPFNPLIVSYSFIFDKQGLDEGQASKAPVCGATSQQTMEPAKNGP